MSSLSARALAAHLAAWRSTSPGPAYLALADRIRLLVLDGRVPLGTRLPAERELAAQLELSRTTVSAAYAELRSAGYLESLRGSGSVARLPGRAPVEPEPLSGLLDFSVACPPAVPHVAEAAVRAASLVPLYLGEHGFDPLGLRVVRQAIADRYTARGLPTDADQVMITAGAQHAIGLVARAVLSRGDRIVVESPSYPHAVEALRSLGGRPVTVPVSTDDGWDDLALEQAFPRTSPTLAYLMPEYHNPTGRVMPEEQRDRVARLAEREGTVLIADETTAELGLDGQAPVPPFAVGRRAVLLGSAGKSVWGGLRMGWIRADRELVQRIARLRSAVDLGTPIPTQLLLLELLPHYEQILVERRSYLRASRDYLAARLAERIPEWSVPRTAGGIASWVGLGAPLSSALALAAREEGLAIAAGPRFGIDGVFERFIRIPFTFAPDDLDRAVDALATAWDRVRRSPLARAEQEYAQVV